MLEIIDNIFESKCFQEDKSFIDARKEEYKEAEKAGNQELMEKIEDETDEEKMDYYHGDLWYDCDYILRKGKETMDCVKIEDEINIDPINGSWENELSEEEEKVLKHFYEDDLLTTRMYGHFLKNSSQYERLETYPGEIIKSNEMMNNATLAIKYRGGQGYAYSWFILIP